jgi:Tol biopolymer transport system component
VIPSTGGAERRAFNEVETPFSWSPDGRWIAFATDHRILVARAEGADEPIRATSGDRLDSSPVWRPRP